MQQIPDDHLSRDKLLSSYGYDKIPKPPQDQEALSRSTSERLNKIKEAVLEVQKLMGSESESFNQYLKENSLLERCELTEQFSKVFEDPQLFANVHLGSSSIGTGYEGLSPDATKAYIKNLLRELYNNRDLGVSIPAEAVLALWTLVEGRYKLESQQLQTSMGIGANNPIEALEKTDELIKQSQSSKLLEKLESGNRPIIAQEIAKRVAYLGIGKSYLMYGGYRSIPSGHAVYYQFKRVSETAYDVYVYNAQQGVMESQGGIITAEKTRGVRCKYFREVPQKVFLFSDNPKEVKGGFFKPLLDILDKTQNSKTAQTCLRTVFESLAPFQDSPTHLEDLFGTLQRAGNCTIHSFNALLFGLYVQESENPKVGVEQYKVTILQARLLSLIAFYRNKEKEIQEDTQDAAQIRFMIKEAAQGLCQRYSKSVNNEKMTDKLLKGSLYTAKDILLRLETIEKNLDKDRVEKDTIPATTVNRKEQAERLESLSDTLVSKGSPLEEATVQVDLSEKIVPLISSSNNPIQLLEQLDKQLSEIAFCGDQWVPLTYIENMVSLLPLSAEGSVWSGLSVEDASISLEKIDRIFSLYTSYIEDLKEIDHLKSQNTLFQLIGIADQLCRVIDQKKQLNFMQGFGLDMLPLEESFLNPNLFFGSEQEINKRNKIQSYFKNQSQEKGTLFAFEKQHVRKSDDPKKELPFYLNLIQQYPEIKKKFPEQFLKNILGSQSALNDSSMELDDDERLATVLLLHDGNSDYFGPEQKKVASLSDIVFFDGDLSYVSRLRGMSKRLKEVYGYFKEQKFSSSITAEAGRQRVDFSGTITHTLPGKEREVVHQRDKNFSWHESLKKPFPQLDQSLFSKEEGPSTFSRKERLTQNEVLQHLNIEDFTLSESNTESDISPYKILERYLDSLDQFKQVDERNKFIYVLFNPYKTKSGAESFPLIKEIATQEQFWKLCQHFIQKGVETYYLNQPRKNLQIDVLLFYFNLSQKLETLYRETHEGKNLPPLMPPEIFQDNRISAPVEALKLWSTQATEGEKEQIHLHIVNEIRKKDLDKLSPEEIKDLFISSVLIKKSKILENRSYEDQVLLSEVSRYIQSALSQLQDFKIDFSQICESVLLQLTDGIGASSGHWNKIDYPVFRKEGEQGSFWELNLLTGVYRNEQGTVKGAGTVSYPDSEREKIFKDRPLHPMRIDDQNYFHDPVWGEMRSSGEVKVSRGWGFTPSEQTRGAGNLLQMKVKDRWFTHVPSSELEKVLPETLRGDYIHFVHYDRATKELECNIYNHFSEKLEYRYRKGRLETISGSEVDLTTLEEEFGDKIKSFIDPSKVCMTIHEKDKRSSLAFTHFKGMTGEPLKLILREDNNWQLSHNPHYKLVNQPAINPFLNDKGILSFSNIHNPRAFKFLVPFSRVLSPEKGYLKTLKKEPTTNYENERTGKLEGSHTFFEVDWVNGELKTESVEGKIQLAQIFLAQKEYQQAFFYLDQIRDGDSLSDESRRVLFSILGSRFGSKMKDSSGNMEAIRLKAYYLLTLLYSNREVIDILLNKEAIKESYINYLSKLNRVDPQITLPIDMELELYQFFKRDGIIDEQIAMRNVVLKGEGEYTTIRAKVGSGSREPTPLWSKTSPGDFPFNLKKDPFDFYLSSDQQEPVEINFNERYSLKRFWSDYQTFREGTESEKESLIAQIEKAVITPNQKPYIFLLKFAYVVGEKAPSIPKKVDKPSFQPWLHKIFSQFNQLSDRSSQSKKKEVEVLTVKEEVKIPNTVQEISPSEMKVKFRIEDIELYDAEEKIQLIRGQFLKRLEAREVAATDYSEDLFSIHPDELEIQDRNYIDLIQEDCRNYMSELQTGRAQNIEIAQNRFKQPEGKELKDLQNSLEKALGESKTLSKQMEQLVLTKLNRIPIGVKEGELTLAKRRDPRTLLEALRAFSSDRPLEQFRKINPHLNKELVEDLEIHIQHYLEEVTTGNQLRAGKKKIDEMLATKEKGPLLSTMWNEASSILAQRREYRPTTNRQALVFEAVTKMKVRSEQAEILRQVIAKLFSEEEPQTGVVFQLMMGGGKTSVILSQLTQLSAQSKKIPLFLCHHSQYASVLGNLKEFQYGRYGQDVITLDYTKEQLSDSEVLEQIQGKIERAKGKKQAIVMKTTFYQSLGLELASLSDELKTALHTPEILKRLKLLAGILSSLREQLQIYDEVDLNLNSLQGVHYPKGEHRYLEPSHIKLIEQMFLIMNTDPNLASMIRLKENKQNLLSDNDYQKNVCPEIARLLIEGKPDNPLKLGQEHISAFQRYVKNEIPSFCEKIALDHEIVRDRETIRQYLVDQGVDQLEERVEDILFLRHLHINLHLHPSQENQEAAQLISLSKYILGKILPAKLKKNNNRHFGRKGLEAIPFLAVGVPATTKIANVYEKCICQFMITSHEGISREYILKMGETYTKEADHYVSLEPTLSFEETEQAREFFKVTNIPLSEYRERVDEAVEHVNDKIEKKLALEAGSSQSSVYDHSRLLSSTPIDAVDQGEQGVACSGTTWNHATYNKKLRGEGNLLLCEGTEGRIMDRMAEEVSAERSFLLEAADNSVESILESSFSKRRGKSDQQIRGLIDVAGLLKQYTNEEAARAIQRYFNQKREVEQPRREVDGVVFLHKDPVTAEERYALLKGKTGEIAFLNNSSKEEVEKHGISTENLFFYYDELRATGTDFKQLPDSVNIVTFDPKSTMMRSLTQATMRLRGFFEGQNADFVVPVESKKYLRDGNISLENLWRSGIKNQSVQKGSQLIASYKDQLMGTIKSKVSYQLQNLILQMENKEDLSKVEEFMRCFDPFLFSKINDDPYELFSSISEELSLEESLRPSFEKYLKMYGEALERFYRDRRGLDQVVEESNSIFKEIEKCTFKVEGATFGNENASVEVSLELEREQEQEQEDQVDNEMEISAEIDHYNSYGKGIPATKEIDWDFTDPNNLNSEYYIKSLSRIFQMEREFSPQYPLYGTFFPENIQMSENFRRTLEAEIPLFHRSSKKASQVLVVGEENPRFILVSDREASQIKKWIAEKQPQGYQLMNLEGFFVESNGDKASISSQDKLKEGIWYMNLLQGNVKYLTKERDYSKKMFKMDNFTSLVVHFLKVRVAGDQTLTNIVRKDPLFKIGIGEEDEYSKEYADSVTPPERQKEITEIRSTEELDQLTPLELFYLDKEQIAQLSSEQIKRVPGIHLDKVPADKIHFLPRSKVKFLATKEQLETFQDWIEKFPSKISWLNEIGQIKALAQKQVHLIRDPFLSRLHPDGFKYLPSEKVKHLGQAIAAGSKQFYLTLKQLDGITPEQVPFLPKKWINKAFELNMAGSLTPEQVQLLRDPKVVEQLEDRQLEYLDPSLIKEVPIKRVQFLKADRDLLSNLPKEKIPGVSPAQVPHIDSKLYDFLVSREQVSAIQYGYRYLTKPKLIVLAAGICEKIYDLDREQVHSAIQACSENVDQFYEGEKEFIESLENSPYTPDPLTKLEHLIWFSKPFKLTPLQKRILARTDISGRVDKEKLETIFDSFRESEISVLDPSYFSFLKEEQLKFLTEEQVKFFLEDESFAERRKHVETLGEKDHDVSGIDLLFLSTEQIKKSCSYLFSYLPPALYSKIPDEYLVFVDSDHFCHIPPDRVKHLRKGIAKTSLSYHPSGISELNQLVIEKFYLKEEQLSGVSPEQVPLVPEEYHHLLTSNEQQAVLQELKMKKMEGEKKLREMEKKLEEIPDEAVGDLSEKEIKWLLDSDLSDTQKRILPLLSSKKQIEYVSKPEHIALLALNQLEHLNNWDLSNFLDADVSQEGFPDSWRAVHDKIKAISNSISINRVHPSQYSQLTTEEFKNECDNNWMIDDKIKKLTPKSKDLISRITTKVYGPKIRQLFEKNLGDQCKKILPEDITE